jgi:hypothetical protein
MSESKKMKTAQKKTEEALATARKKMEKLHASKTYVESAWEEAEACKFLDVSRHKEELRNKSKQLIYEIRDCNMEINVCESTLLEIRKRASLAEALQDEPENFEALKEFDAGRHKGDVYKTWQEQYRQAVLDSVLLCWRHNEDRMPKEVLTKLRENHHIVEATADMIADWLDTNVGRAFLSKSLQMTIPPNEVVEAEEEAEEENVPDA